MDILRNGIFLKEYLEILEGFRVADKVVRQAGL